MVVPAGAPGSITNPASQASSGGVAADRAAAGSSPAASAQLNIAQSVLAGSPVVPVSNASETGAGSAADAAAGGGDAGPARIGVGGHIGVVLPLVTRAGGATTSISDSFSIGMPVGITIHGQGRMAFDMEFVPLVQNSPRQVNLTFHPGLIWSVGHRFSVGMRAAFDANSTQFGFTPLLNKSWPIEGGFFKAYFVEADLPVRFNRPAGLPASDPVTFAVHFGLGF